jgi:hypothetical protein
VHFDTGASQHNYQFGGRSFSVGSHFVTLSSVDPQRVRRVFGSNDRTLLDDWLSLIRKQRHWDPELIAGCEVAARTMVAGNSHRGESDEGSYFIRAFNVLCKAWATAHADIECYVDEGWPELWAFVTQTDDPPFDIPQSSSGVPFFGWLAGETIAEHRNAFAKYEPTDELAETYGATQSNIEELQRVLADAEASGRAVALLWEV